MKLYTVKEQSNILHEISKRITWRKNQLDATQLFIEPVICSTCFGHLYAHHQELKTILLVTTCGV
jgi:hypothetical protein